MKQTKDYVLYDSASKQYIGEVGFTAKIEKAKRFSQTEAEDYFVILRKSGQYFEIKKV